MSHKILIINANVVNEMETFRGGVLIVNGLIEKVFHNQGIPGFIENPDDIDLIDAEGKYLLPGIIDDQVHFREPGLTHKADIYSESKAAVAGGITSFMEMPNTVPNTLTQVLLEEKYKLASEKSLANYSFYMGASNDNFDEILRTDPSNVCGIKVFMGASTGNMLVDDINTLNDIFSKAKLLVAVHCEDEPTIQENLTSYKDQYGEDIPIQFHPAIRSEKACYKSSSLAVELAKKFNTRLHILHLSTAKELAHFSNRIPLEKKRITAEVCVHHLWFNSTDYNEKGNFIKWNPAIKTRNDQEALLNAVIDDYIDVIATDHAPHTREEKTQVYTKAPSGGPLVQHSLLAMLNFYHEGKISLGKIVEKMCHAPAICFQVVKRGFIREGYWADLVLVDLYNETQVESGHILYKCGWSPFEGQIFLSKITHTFVNGHPVYENETFDETLKGKRLIFNR
ncbi:dihydroorotase [candidate division KSB1 bacterium]